MLGVHRPLKRLEFRPPRGRVPAMEIIHILYDRGHFHGPRFPCSDDSDGNAGRDVGVLEGMDQWQGMDALTWSDNRGHPYLPGPSMRGGPVRIIGDQPG
ncbi:hypothetical protein OAH35_00220 [bacterium]|nr:hypothetical protein [bacterium]MDB4675681.1 hypothetical protein [Akkermansiaceae bacterium]MDC0305602.1 hypothetical protein [Akkermansiaceae bacterium]